MIGHAVMPSMRRRLTLVGLACAAMYAPGLAFPPAAPVAAGLQDPPRPAQTQLDLTMKGPAGTRTLALSTLVVPEGDPGLAEAARVLVAVLWADLDFEREFVLVSPEAAARVPAAATPEGLRAEQWAELGADLVLTGSVRRDGDTLEVELRSIAVRGADAGSQHFGSRYGGCTVSAPRSCAHYIADDFHKRTTGLDGIAQTRLAFVSNRDGLPLAGRPLAEPGASKEIYIADYDGANVRRVTASRHLHIAPAWSPDGRSLVYTSWESGFQDIYVMHPFGGGPRVRPAPGDANRHHMLAEWSPDGTRLVFEASGANGYSDVYVVNRDGAGMRNLTPNTPRWSDGAPTWAPTGQQIAFTSDRSGTNQVYTMSADGTLVKRMHTGPHADSPSWSSRNYIAFALQAPEPGRQDIAVLDLQTGEVRVLTGGPGSHGSPAVAPNGRHIAFTTTRWGREQIAIIDYPTGTRFRRVTETGSNSYPAWSPVPRGER
jgi:TolB protein